MHICFYIKNIHNILKANKVPLASLIAEFCIYDQAIKYKCYCPHCLHVTCKMSRYDGVFYFVCFEINFALNKTIDYMTGLKIFLKFHNIRGSF